MSLSLPLSEAFTRRIVSVWGDEGARWLDRLPALVASCAERWGLSIESTPSELSYNFVAFVVTADRREAVLKLGVPDSELRAEIAALRAFRRRPVVDLLEADSEAGALLLGRLVPGRPLSDLTDDDEATVIAAHLIRDLALPEPVDASFPTIGQWAFAFDRLRAAFSGKTGPLPGRMVDKAEQLLKDLELSSTGPMLLHGDLHHDNILSCGEGAWRAIDPKGVIGDPTYEAARLQHNPIPGFLAMDRPLTVALRRADILSSILKADRARLLAWAFFDAVLAACWSIEENGDFRYFLACAELFDRLA